MAKTCPSCGYSPIGPFTDNCPICAEPVRNVRGGARGGSGGGRGTPDWVRWLIIGGAIAIVGVAAFCGLGLWRMGGALQDAQQAADRARAAAEAKKLARTVTIPARHLLQEFRDDAEAADRKYRGKYLVVAGVVEKAGRQGRGQVPFVVLHGGDEKGPIKIECFFFPDGGGADDDDNDEGAFVPERVRPGDTVVVRGEYDGRVTNVKLSECELGK